MAIVFNATNELVTVKAHGNWFTFKPKQFKVMNDEIANFLVTARAEKGLVSLPNEFEDPSYSRSEEGQEILAKQEAEGIARYLAKLTEIVNNNRISLKKDLQMKNIQTDPSAFMSDGEMYAMEKLAEYRFSGKDEQQKRIDRIKELSRELDLDDSKE